MVPTTNTAQMAQMKTSFRTTTPSAPATTAKQVDPVHAHKSTSWSGPPAHCAHVHKSTKQVCRPGELLALRKVKHPHNGRTSVNRLPLTKQDILSHYSGSFEGHTIKKKLRIYLDPRDLNEALEREPYHTHSVDEITAKLQGMTVFTIVDFKKGYFI